MAQRATDRRRGGCAPDPQGQKEKQARKKIPQKIFLWPLRANWWDGDFSSLFFWHASRCRHRPKASSRSRAACPIPLRVLVTHRRPREIAIGQLFFICFLKKREIRAPIRGGWPLGVGCCHLRCRTARSQRAVRKKWNPSIFTFCSMPFSVSCRGCVENRPIPKGHPALARGGAITSARLCGLRDRGN